MPTTAAQAPAIGDMDYLHPTRQLREYLMLDALDRAGEDRLTQRELGRRALLSPAVVNEYLADFLSDGLVEREALNARDYRYSLTEAGRHRCRELMVGYIRETFQLFQAGKDQLARLLHDHQRRHGLGEVVFYSAGQVTEVLLAALQETELRLVAIVDDDPTKQGASFYGYPVVAPDAIGDYAPDAVIVTTFRYREAIRARLAETLSTEIPVIGF